MVEINGNKFYNLKDLMIYMTNHNVNDWKVGYCTNMKCQDEALDKLELLPFYSMIKDAPQLPQDTTIWINTYKECAMLKLEQKLLTTAGSEIAIEITNDGMFFLWIDGKYECSRRDFTKQNAKFLFKKCVKGDLVVDEIFLPLEVFGYNKYIGSIFEQYARKFKDGIVMHPANLYINGKVDLVKCYLLRMT